MNNTTTTTLLDAIKGLPRYPCSDGITGEYFKVTDVLAVVTKGVTLAAPIVGNPVLENLVREHNAAVANGLMLRARSLNRQIESIEREQARVDAEGRPTMNPHPSEDGVWR